MDKKIFCSSFESSIIKKIIVFTILIFFVSSDGFSYIRGVRKNRYGQDITVKLDAALYQIKMINYENSVEQKFLESAMRVTVGKYYSNGFKMEASYTIGLNKVGKLFDNSESSDVYIRIYNTRMLMLTGSYDYYIDDKIYISPKLGFGRMDYKEEYDGNLTEKFNRNNISELLKIGVDYNYALSRNFSMHLGAEYLFGKDQLKFPLLTIGSTYHISSSTIKRIARNCPSIF